ncbi:MAG TPA: ABC transporter permease [Devosia sp.]|nr:ABC transporter permease [Devosia sp.]
MSDVDASGSGQQNLLGAALKSPSFMIGLVLTLIFTAGALLSFIWTPFEVDGVDIPNRLKCPPVQEWIWGLNFPGWGTNWFASWRCASAPQYLLGTDHFGRDVLSMVMVGARTSIAVAVVAVGIGIVLGVPLGLAAAARRGSLLDEIIMRTNDLVFAFPALLIAILITAVFGPSAVNAIIAIGIFNIPVFARLTRGAALSLWTREFVLAARVAGKGPVLISFEHILPNILNLLIVQGTIQFSLGILAEAALSYVGLGAQPPIPSWGRMLAEAQTMIAIAPHLALFPGFAIVLTVLGLNLMGDGLRDILDPKLRREKR